MSSEDNNSLANPSVGESMKKLLAVQGMLYSFCYFGSPYNRGVVTSEFFSLKLASFVIFSLSSKLLTNLLTSWVVDAVGLVLSYL